MKYSNCTNVELWNMYNALPYMILKCVKKFVPELGCMKNTIIRTEKTLTVLWKKRPNN